MYYEVIPVKSAGKSALTYSAPLDSSKNLIPGTIVLIPLRNQHVPGLVLKSVPAPDFKTKPIAKVLYDRPLPSHLLKSLLWLSDYYCTDLSTTARLFLPPGVEKSRRSDKRTDKNQHEQSVQAEFRSAAARGLAAVARGDGPTERVRGTDCSADSDGNNELTVSGKALLSSTIPLNPAQQQALKQLQETKTTTSLLHGITGSGKTNIYLTLAASALSQGRSTILLVPEIALTGQLVQIFHQHFDQHVILIHSAQTESSRHKTWEKILQTDAPKIIIGPRSALFAPVKNLAYILIDEAHETTYFQENPPRYSALRLASAMSKFASTKDHQTKTILGTATPKIEDYYLAEHNNSLVTLTEKAKSSTKNETTDLKLIDLKDKSNFKKSRYFSDQLLEQIDQNLKDHKQTLIFHNRRGSAPLTLCDHCGWQALCENCFLPLTLHADRYELLCHTCGSVQKIPTSCPDCGHPDIIHKGFGTKLLEQELKKLYKDAKIARFDGDNKKSESLAENYDTVKTGDVDLIIGTQAIAKGLDLPNLKTVAVVQADAGLSLPDFAAEEHTFALLTQVLGRIGRGHQSASTAVIQTFQPDSPVVQAALHADYQTFYQATLKKRQKSAFPPYTYLLLLSVTYKTEETTLKYIRQLKNQLDQNPKLKVEQPTPAFHERTARGYTWQLLVKSKSRSALRQAAASLPEINGLHFTLDPPSLL